MQAKRIRKIAIFHDNFAQMGGAERVAEALYKTLPSADMRTTLQVSERLSPFLKALKIRTTWMQKLPFKAKLFRHYFLLYPFAIEGVDLSEYDLIVSTCFGYAKGVKRRSDAVHVCYCHTPMRWISRTDDYLKRESFSPWMKRVIRLLLKPLKKWEAVAATRPDYYIANSQTVARRLQEAFGVESTVIPPPIDTCRFHLSDEIGDYFLVISRLVPYKRIDLAVAACSNLGVKLIVIGAGPDRARLQAAAGPSVSFLGKLSDEDVVRYAARCRALIFPGEEDFGMTPLEVNAAGRPVIAFRGGGALETVVEGVTGLFFDRHEVPSVEDAIQRFERSSWDPQAIRRHALGYDTAVFQRRILDFLSDRMTLPNEAST